MSTIPQLWFHDSSILKFSKDNNTINLEISQAVDKEENNYLVRITLNNISKIESDASYSESNLMASTHGEVLTLNFKDQRAELIALWVNFNGLESFTKYYYIDCKEILISAQPIKTI